MAPWAANSQATPRIQSSEPGADSRAQTDRGRVPTEPRAWAMLTPDQAGMGDKFKLSDFLKGKAGPSFKGIMEPVKSSSR